MSNILIREGKEGVLASKTKTIPIQIRKKCGGGAGFYH